MQQERTVVKGRAETHGCGFRGRMSRFSPSWEIQLPAETHASPWARLPQTHPRGAEGRARPSPRALSPGGAEGRFQGGRPASPGAALGAQSAGRVGESPSRGHGPGTPVRTSGSRWGQCAVLRAPPTRCGVLLRLPAFPGRTCACVAFSPRSLSIDVPGCIPGAGDSKVDKPKAGEVLSGPENGTRVGGRSPWLWWRGRADTRSAGRGAEGRGGAHCHRRAAARTPLRRGRLCRDWNEPQDT